MTTRRVRWTASEDELAKLVRDAEGRRSTRLLSASDIDVALQPIVDMKTGKLFAIESLVRCKWPEYKNPFHLFQKAEEENSCGRLGRPIREVAIAAAAGYPLFLNIHPEELASRWLVRPDDPMTLHDAPLYLEITESAAFEYFDLVQGVLREVCARTSAQLVVDDLGAGHSNLKRILDLEPAVVKLDRELVRELDQHPRQRTLVTAVIDLCQDLGAKVVAEGIETVDELKACRDCGADYGQGYLLAKPANPVPAVNWPL